MEVIAPGHQDRIELAGAVASKLGGELVLVDGQLHHGFVGYGQDGTRADAIIDIHSLQQESVTARTLAADRRPYSKSQTAARSNT